MKKTLLIILCVISANAYAQLDCDLGMKLASPSDPNIILNFGDSVTVYMNITNYGPDTVDTSDYVLFRFDDMPTGYSLIALDSNGQKVIIPPDSTIKTRAIKFSYDISPYPNDSTFQYCFYFSHPPFYFISDTNAANDTVCINITYKGVPTGIKDIKESNFFSAYPNPTTDDVFLKFDKNLNEPLHIRVYNVVGKLLSQYQILKVNSDNKQKVDLSPYPSDMYFIEAYTDKMKQRIKVVKR